MIRPVLVLLFFLTATARADDRFPLFAYLTDAERPAALVGYTPSELDPRNPGSHAALKTSSIRADLVALRPAFDGLILYGYHEADTPRILAVAQQLDYRAVILGVWEPKSAAELDGVAAAARQFHGELALAVCVGNEGITFGRYEPEDLTIAAARLRQTLPADVPLTTTEPLATSQSPVVLAFGDFLLPNIHPVFDAPQLPADAAAAWVRQQAKLLADKAGKPVFVKETGFPHAGKPQFSPAAQAAFWRAYRGGAALTVEAEPTRWISFAAAFEAFDAPWKAESSGLPMEADWGLLSAKRVPYPAFAVWAKGR